MFYALLSGNHTRLSEVPPDFTEPLHSSATEQALCVFLDCLEMSDIKLSPVVFAVFAANRMMTAAGTGILTITDRHMEQFNVLLCDFYNTGDREALNRFLYENAIIGMTI